MREPVFASRAKTSSLPVADVHDAVFYDGRVFQGILAAEAGAQMGDPGAFQILHIGGVDLIERGETRVVPVAADGEPFLPGRLAQIGNPLALQDEEGKEKTDGNRNRRYF